MSERLVKTALNGTLDEFAKVFREEFFASVKKNKEGRKMKVSYKETNKDQHTIFL